MLLAQIFDLLKEKDLMKNTIVVLAGDHGEEYYEKGLLGHSSRFNNEQTMTTLILYYPGIKPGVYTQMSSHLDIVPMLAGLFGVQNPSQDYSCGFDLLSPQAPRRRYKIIKERFEQEQKRREQHQENMSKIATMACVGNNGKPINHPYLTKKQIICPNDITFDHEQNALLIPVSDLNGKIWGYQTIFSDGQKRFLKGARKKGCMYCFGNITSADKIFVCEGFATGASLYDATNITTVVAFDAGNIDFVVGEIIRKYPQKRIIIAADNDIGKTQNTGAETAKSVVNKYHISAILPDKLIAGMSDWNDIACKYGKNEIIKQLTKGGIL